MNVYNNKNVELKIKNCVNKFIELIDFILGELEECHAYINDKTTEDIKDMKENDKILNNLIKIKKLSFSITAHLVDIYFLRRFLDKDYITNGIVYAGAAHVAFFVNILINEFNFSITHVSKSKTTNLIDLETKIKEIKPIIQNFPKILDLLDVFQSDQCSDISSFPKNFL